MVRTQVLTILWILHLSDHHPCRCGVTLSPFVRCCCQTTHSNTSSTIWLPICRPTYCIPSQYTPLPPSSLWQTVTLSSSPPTCLSNPLVTLLVSNSIWLIYRSLLGKWLWSGLDSCRQLVGRPAAADPTYLFISTLINGQRRSKVNLLLLKHPDLKTNKYLFYFSRVGGRNGFVILISHMSVLGRTVNSWKKIRIMWLWSSWPKWLNIQDGWMIDQHLFDNVKTVF